MPVPRLVLIPLDAAGPTPVNPGNTETPKATDPGTEQACSIGRTQRATPWLWLLALASTGFGRRLINRKRRS